MAARTAASSPRAVTSCANVSLSASTSVIAERICGVSHLAGTVDASHTRALACSVSALARAGAKSLLRDTGCQLADITSWNSSSSFQPVLCSSAAAGGGAVGAAGVACALSAPEVDRTAKTRATTRSENRRECI